MPDAPENLGLLALILLHDSRRTARINAQGELVTMEEMNVPSVSQMLRLMAHGARKLSTSQSVWTWEEAADGM